MKPRTLAWAILLPVLGGCGGVHLSMPNLNPKPLVLHGDPLTTCQPANPCSKVANRHQYYDQRVNRYYYFDRTVGRYFWENGDPRFQGTEPPNPDNATPAKGS